MKKSLVMVVAMLTMIAFASVSMAQAPAKSDKPAAVAPEKPAPAADKTKSESPKADKKTDEKKPEEKKPAPAEKKG